MRKRVEGKKMNDKNDIKSCVSDFAAVTCSSSGKTTHHWGDSQIKMLEMESDGSWRVKNDAVRNFSCTFFSNLIRVALLLIFVLSLADLKLLLLARNCQNHLERLCTAVFHRK